jgi:hypothetical protein
MNRNSIPYSAEELHWIEVRAQDPRRETHAAFCKERKRTDVSLSNYNALCKRKGWLTGRNGRFEAGQPSWNKGKPMPSHFNSKKTQFKKGALPANRLPMWSERTDRDGYILIKVPLPNPFVTGQKTRFMHKQRYLWEKENGPLPKGQILKCLDGDKTNCAPANWKAIPRAMLPRLSGRFGRGYEQAPEELKLTIMAVTDLEFKIKQQSEGAL